MRKEILITLLLILLLGACGKKEPEPEPTSPLPAPSSPLSQPPASPLQAPTSQPPAAAPTPMPLLTLVEPIGIGATIVRGSGPAGVPIRLHDVGLTGLLLGEGVIGQDGTFSIQLLDPLEAGQRVGLALGDLEGTPFKRHHFVDQAIIDLPVIGLLFADVTVE